MQAFPTSPQGSGLLATHRFSHTPLYSLPTLITCALSSSPMSLTTSASPSYLCVLAHSLEVNNLFQLIIIQWIINLCIGRYRHVYMCIWQWEQFLMGPYDFSRLHTRWHGVLLAWPSSDPFIWPNFPWFSCSNDWYAICQSDSWVNELWITKGYRFQPLGNRLNNIRCQWPFQPSEGSQDALSYVGRLDWWAIFIWSIGGMHRLVVGWWEGRGMRIVGLCRSPGLVFAFWALETWACHCHYWDSTPMPLSRWMLLQLSCSSIPSSPRHSI